jgi:hypothetical protein
MYLTLLKFRECLPGDRYAPALVFVSLLKTPAQRPHGPPQNGSFAVAEMALAALEAPAKSQPLFQVFEAPLRRNRSAGIRGLSAAVCGIISALINGRNHDRFEAG